MKIKLGHCPDPEDAFMLFGLLAGMIDPGRFDIEYVVADIHTLNDRAARGDLEVTAISAGAYPYVRDKYVLAKCGASFARQSGPKIVSREPMGEEDLAGASLGVPGMTTSAYLALQLYRPGIRTILLPPDKIIAAVEAGVVDCALVAHGGQVGHEQIGLHSVADLSVWWTRRTDGLPLPLGVMAVRKDLPCDVRTELTDLLAASIHHAGQHPSEAVQYAMQYAEGMDPASVGEVIGTYVSDLGTDMGSVGKQAIEEFLSRGQDGGFVPEAMPIELVESN